MNLSYWAGRLGLDDERDLWGDIFIMRSRYNEKHYSEATMETFIVASLRRRALGRPNMGDRCLSLESMVADTNDFMSFLDRATVMHCGIIEDPIEEVIFRETIESVKSKLSGKRLKLFKRLLRPSKKIRREAMIVGKKITLEMLIGDIMSVQTARKIISEQIRPMLERVSNE